MRNAKYDETDYARDKKVIDDPEMVPLESVDLFVTPHMQQGRIANEYMLEHEIVLPVLCRMKISRRRISMLW